MNGAWSCIFDANAKVSRSKMISAQRWRLLESSLSSVCIQRRPMIQPLNAHYHKQNILFKCHQENETRMCHDQKLFQFFHQTLLICKLLCLNDRDNQTTNLWIKSLERVGGSLLSPDDHDVTLQHPHLTMMTMRLMTPAHHSPEASSSGWCRGQAS